MGHNQADPKPWGLKLQLAWVFGLLGLAFGLVVALLLQQYRAAHDSLTGRELARHELAWTALRVLADARAELWFDTFVNVPELRSLMTRAQDPALRDAARADLIAYLEPRFSQMRAAGVDILHFHLPGGISFYRSYQPERFGDSLLAHRHLIGQVNARHEPVAAIEAGRLQLAYRSIWPILAADGRFLGSVEFSVPLANKLPDLAAFTPERDYEILLRSDYANLPARAVGAAERQPWHGSARLFTQSPIVGEGQAEGQVIASRVAPVLAADQGRVERMLTLPGGTLSQSIDKQVFLTVFSSLLDARGEPVGLLLSHSREPGLQRLWRNLWLNSSLAAGALLLLALAAIVMLRSRVRVLEERSRSEREMKLAASVFRTAREGIIVIGSDRRIIDANDAAVRITGYRRDELVGQQPGLLLSEEFVLANRDRFWQALREEGFWQAEAEARRASGEVFPIMVAASTAWADEGGLSHFVVLFTDITRQKQHAEELYRIAYYDALTGLPNRTRLVDRIDAVMAATVDADQKLVLGVVDLDGFKCLNENHGRKVGDQALVEIGQRLRDALPTRALLGRLGGDEFAFVVSAIDDAESAHEHGKALLEVIARPLELAATSSELRVSASIGLTVYPQREDVDADQLLRQADQAMYRAKVAGKNRCDLFDLEHDLSTRERLRRAAEVAAAIESGQLVLYFQPKVNLRTGELLGVEALVRWQHPDRGLLSPGEFLPVVEHHPVEVDLSRWVLRQALLQARAWQSAGHFVPVAVNVAGGHVQHPDFVPELASLMDEFSDLAPGSLALEVVETSALGDIEGVCDVMQACRELGVLFELDDFGTGYSSLNYLKRLPIRGLKIDRSFVHGMFHEPDDLAILEGVLSIARAFGHHVIAEGVETVEEGRLLLYLGCEQAQGYAIARPMPAEGLLGWRDQWRPDPGWRGITRLGEAQLDLIFAMVEHRAWVAELAAWLDGLQAEPPVLDESDCRFGQRLAAGTSWPSDSVALDEIRAIHREIHQLADALVARCRAEPDADCGAEFAALERQRDQLVDRLQRLLDDPL